MLKYLELGNYIYLPTYNLLIGVGFILGLLILEKDILNIGLNSNEANHLKTSIIIAFISGFLGAFIFDAIVKSIPFEFEVLKSNVGFTFYGGFIFGLLSLLISYKILKIKVYTGLNVVVPFLLISHAFGRVGCFFAGCCYGKPTNSILGVIFPVNSFPYNEYHGSISVHPTQIYEAIFLLIMFFICIKYISFFNRVIFYLISYGLFRFWIEFLRADERGTLFNQNNFSPSQLISLGLIIAGLFLFIKTKKVIIKK